MNKAKYVLLVTSEFPPQPGGIGNHAHYLSKYLQEHQFDVQVICDNRSYDGIEEQEFDKMLTYKVHRIIRKQKRFIMYFKRIKRLFQLIKDVDIVIASGKFSLWMVAFSSLFYSKNFIAIVHGTEVNFKKRLLKISIELALRRFGKVIAVSEYTRSLISYLKLKRVFVIPNGFEADAWSLRSVEPIDLTGHPKLITVGNLTERKGQLHVIRQLPKLLKTFPQLHYHCVGIPTEQERFLDEATALNVKKHISFHGQVDDEVLRQLLASSDVFVMLSSPTESGDVEGFGIAILEANALGLPAIGSLGCGIEDAIKPNVSGFLISYNDSAQFLDALKRLLDNPATFKIKAQEWAQNFDWKFIIKRYVEIIGEHR
jgi:phosphatidylinositol alpha-1,6-mannosyltransferase